MGLKIMRMLCGAAFNLNLVVGLLRHNKIIGMFRGRARVQGSREGGEPKREGEEGGGATPLFNRRRTAALGVTAMRQSEH
jgi:hypothetical protein